MEETNINDNSTAGEDRSKILCRQVESKVEIEGQASSAAPMVSFSKLISLASGVDKCKLYFGYLFAILTGAVLPMFFFFLGPIFDSFSLETTPDEAADKIRTVCIIMFGLALGIVVTTFFQNWLLMSASANVAADLKTRYLQSILNQDSQWFDTCKDQNALASKIGKEIDLIQKGIGQKQGGILYSLTMCCSGFVVGFYKGWTLSFAMLGIAPIMLIGMGIFASAQAKRSQIASKAYAQSAGYASQALAAVRIVVSFGNEELEVTNYNRFLEQCRIAGLKSGVTGGFTLGFFFFTIYLSYAYAFLMGAIWVDQGYWNDAEDRVYLAGDCIAVFFGVLIGLFSLGGAGPNMMAVTEAKAAGKEAFEVIDNIPSIQQDDKTALDHKLKGEIEFKNVTFYYPSRPDFPAMKSFSHKFEIGKQTAIVGPSGSGKSTTVQLVERFYDPKEGQVLIDGNDLKSINLRSYRQQIGYVGQEPVLFNTTIKQNILMGKPDATDAEIMDALKQTNAWEFVSKYPDGMNEQVGQGGGKLSGGQKQRIALARAFIKKPRVLIFDEATSALDRRNEKEVLNAIEIMKKTLGSVTTIVIAHRLTTVKDSDNIIVVKGGEKVEEGNHETLLRNFPDGIYAKLCKADAAGKNDEDEQPI